MVEFAFLVEALHQELVTSIFVVKIVYRDRIARVDVVELVIYTITIKRFAYDVVGGLEIVDG